MILSPHPPPMFIFNVRSNLAWETFKKVQFIFHHPSCRYNSKRIIWILFNIWFWGSFFFGWVDGGFIFFRRFFFDGTRVKTIIEACGNASRNVCRCFLVFHKSLASIRAWKGIGHTHTHTSISIGDTSLTDNILKIHACLPALAHHFHRPQSFYYSTVIFFVLCDCGWLVVVVVVVVSAVWFLLIWLFELDVGGFDGGPTVCLLACVGTG